MSRALLAGVALIGITLAALRGGGADPPDPAEPRPGLRRPTALALADDGRWLFVANRRSGTVSVIDTETLKVADEVSAGRRLSDLAVTPDGARVLVLDEDAGELVSFRRQGSRLDAPVRVKVNPDPVSIQVAADGSHCYVACLWPRRLAVVDLGGADGPRVRRSVPLPFPPRRQVLLADPPRLVVADAFGGRLAVIDPDRGEVESVRTLPAHNIGGLAASGDGRGLLVTHQALSGRATTGLSDIHWGNLLTNNLRELPLDGVRGPRADLLQSSELHHLGDAGRGAGDPAGVAVAPGGAVVLALAGVGEVAVGGKRDGTWDRIPVGRRPTAVAVSPDGRRAFVANTFSDSVSVLDLRANRVTAEVPLGKPAELAAADRGELLFHDARLSHDGWFSCQSCHTDGHTNGLLADTFGDGSHGTPKRVPSLLGVKDTAPFGWTGGVKDLETQVRSSVETTMRGAKLSPAQGADLAAYLRTLPPPPRDHFAAGREEGAVRRGAAVFRQQGCANCHEPPTYTTPRAYDIGLADEAGNRAFNPPSLRGVSQDGPFFHDGRAATLREVLTKHRHGLKADLGREDLADLLAFLADL